MLIIIPNLVGDKVKMPKITQWTSKTLEHHPKITWNCLKWGIYDLSEEFFRIGETQTLFQKFVKFSNFEKKNRPSCSASKMSHTDWFCVSWNFRKNVNFCFIEFSIEIRFVWKFQPTQRPTHPRWQPRLTFFWKFEIVTIFWKKVQVPPFMIFQKIFFRISYKFLICQQAREWKLWWRFGDGFGTVGWRVLIMARRWSVISRVI